MSAAQQQQRTASSCSHTARHTTAPAMAPSDEAAAAAMGGSTQQQLELELYPAMRLQRLGSIAVVQPVWQGEPAGPSLTADLETGTLALAEHPKVCSTAGSGEVGGLDERRMGELRRSMRQPGRCSTNPQALMHCTPTPNHSIHCTAGGQGLYRGVWRTGPGPPGGRPCPGGGHRRGAGATKSILSRVALLHHRRRLPRAAPCRRPSRWRRLPRSLSPTSPCCTQPPRCRPPRCGGTRCTG